MTFKEKIIFSVVSWAWWQRYAATALFLIALLSAWWFLSFRAIWQQTRLAMHANTNKIAQQERVLAPEDVVPGAIKTESIADVFAKRTTAFFMIPTVREATDMVLSRIAAERLRVENYSLTPVQTKEWYETADMQLHIVGTFFSVINFLERLQRYENIIMQRFELVAEESCPVSTMSGDCPMKLLCTITIIAPLT